jgi:tRNA-modifying protein YgfZ
MHMKSAVLPDRAVVKVAGEDARKFLNGLLTTDIGAVSPTHARYAALLTPQGKIIVDCIVVEAPPAEGGGFFLDCPRALAGAFVNRLNLYKLRAKVIVEDLSEILAVLVAWGGAPAATYALSYCDPRLPELGLRVLLAPSRVDACIAALGATRAEAADYEAHRIALGVPRGGLDFSYGDAFPHEADMDQLAGVDFDKGCFIGQEVVSRIEHRGTARTRVVPVDYDGPAPETGIAVTAGDKPLGTFGSAADGHGLALLRLDRTTDALAAGLPVVAGGVALKPHKPAWARFQFPSNAKAAE